MNTSYKRLIVIGDIHGCLAELRKLLNLASYNKDYDRVILTGDLVDRGPAPAETIQTARELGLECVCGNHDNKFIRYRNHELKRYASLLKGEKHPYKNPMRFKPEKQKVYEQLSSDDHDWLASLPNSIYIREMNLLVVHAGVRPGQNPLGQPGDIYRHCRYVFNDRLNLAKLSTETYEKPANSSFWGDLYDGTINIIHGHQVFDLNKPNIITTKNGTKVFGIDTGCCFGGNLTALVFNNVPKLDYEFVQVKAEKVYYPK